MVPDSEHGNGGVDADASCVYRVDDLFRIFVNAQDKDFEAAQLVQKRLREMAEVVLKQIIPAGIQYTVARRGPHITINDGNVIIVVNFDQYITCDDIVPTLEAKVPGGKFYLQIPVYGWFAIPVAEFDRMALPKGTTDE